MKRQQLTEGLRYQIVCLCDHDLINSPTATTHSSPDQLLAPCGLPGKKAQ